MTATWPPTAEEVHALIPHRNDGKVFSELSRPTDAQVNLIIEGRAAEVAGEAVFGGTVPVAWRDQAAHVVRLGAAADIELAYPHDDTGGIAGSGPSLLDRFEAALARLLANVAGTNITTERTTTPAAATTGHASAWGVQPDRRQIRLPS